VILDKLLNITIANVLKFSILWPKLAV